MNCQANAEALTLLGNLLEAIHKLNTSDALAVMDADVHMRTGSLSSEDLARLREIARRALG